LLAVVLAVEYQPSSKKLEEVRLSPATVSTSTESVCAVDMIVIYNSGRFRMGGRGSLAGLLPFKDANAVVLEMADEACTPLKTKAWPSFMVADHSPHPIQVLPVVKNVPVLAGVCATDPFRNMDRFLKQIKKVGFAGVQNFPTVGLIDGNFRYGIAWMAFCDRFEN